MAAKIQEWMRQSTDPLIQYGVAIEDHKALGHTVYDTFWESHCRDCSWRARLTCTGEPFNPNRHGEFQLRIEEP